MLTEDAIRNIFRQEFEQIERKFSSSLDEVKNSIRLLNRRVRDIESDQRTTQAIGRAIQASGISFKDTRIPYPLQGNAAIEDIKDYY